jgi:hypothetical protein
MAQQTLILVAPPVLAEMIKQAERPHVSLAEPLLRAAEAERACGRVSSIRGRSVLRRQVIT